jgi:hypothetical protein
MSDRIDSAITPVSPVSGVRPSQAVRSKSAEPSRADVGAITGGSLPAAYAQVVANPDTHDLVIRVRHATTDEVISEHPSREVQAMDTSLRQYAAVLARLRASKDS